MAGGGGGEEGDFGLQIAPMLDILFVLLLFFMVCAGSQKKELNLTSPLPGGGPEDKTRTVPMNIDIGANKVVTMNGSTYGVIMFKVKNVNKPSELQMKLTSVILDNDEQPIIITPSPLAEQQTVMDVLNACAGAHVKNIAFSQVQVGN